ncbi:MAG: hypothetical protein OEM26_07030 [Saprospiraceae bacterium]|nr:hypothetical protein [Saprospiraceae bacterium]
MNNSLQVAIDKVKEQFVKAYQARNAAKIADLYSSGGILYPANGANVRAGHPYSLITRRAL